jgi:nucleoside-diphosphate-sugar epimerase
MYEWMKKGKYRIVGSGANYIPRIHVEDCAEAYVRVLEKKPIGERFIIADDGPCTVREFADCMAKNMNVPKPKSVPGLIIRAGLGKLMYETITMNCRVSNAKAKKFLDWAPKYSTYREGLPAAIRNLEKGN